jgi:hypothetical protein
MRSTTILTALAAITLVASCSDQPTAPSRSKAPTAPELRRNGPTPRAALLTDVPVTGALSDGGTFTGTLTVTHIAVDQATKVLTVTGTLTGTATTIAGVATELTNLVVTAPATLSRSAAAAGVIHEASMATCGILFLDLGPLHLDLLGLTLDLNEVVLALNAVSGAGNLLGNLLCAVVSLLDLPGIIADISQLVSTINNILGGLSGMGVGGVNWIMPSVPGLSQPILRS